MSHAKEQRRKEDRQWGEIIFGCSLFCLFSWYSLCDLCVLSGAGVRNGLAGRTGLTQRNKGAKRRKLGVTVGYV